MEDRVKGSRGGAIGVPARVAGLVLFAGLLAACASDEDPQLMNLRSSTNGPDEFAIIPPKPLEMPESLTELPDPTPGGANLTDPNPQADAILALGGTPRDADGGIPSADSALFAHATRLGVTDGIREVLAAEDLEYRRRNDGRLLERLFDVNVYFKAYADMFLDQFAELEKWRLAGAVTPSAPPRLDGE